MIRQSPLPLTRLQFSDDDPRWLLPGYNRKKESAKLWKGPKTLADRLWDIATSPVQEDIPPGDEDLLPPGRGQLRSPVMVEATQMLWTRSSLKGRVIIEDAGSAKATAEAWTIDRGRAVFTDGSKGEDGWTGCAAVWRNGEGGWQGRKIFMGRNKEVFDAELYAIWLGLKATRDHQGEWAAVGPKSITIFTDSQAALKRMKNDDPGPGQWLARRILRTERQLRQAGWTTEFRWIPGHKGVEGNEVADRWAKEGAGASSAERLPRKEESITTLAHVARGVTETKWHEHLAWVKERCHGKRYYHLKESQRTDPVASRARKAVASRFYQFRMGKARIGPYLAMVGQAENDKCWWCGSGASQTREHLFKYCGRWKDQRVTMWRDIGKATRTGWKRTIRNTSMAQLFGDERCTPAILEFLAQTEVGTTGRLRARRLWGESDSETDGDDGETVYEDGRVRMEHEVGVET
jgi:ribonuclease HI